MLWAYPSKVFTPIHMNHTNEAKLAELVLTELSCETWSLKLICGHILYIPG